MSETKTKKFINRWLLISFVILVISGLYLLFIWKKIPPEIPWYYSLPWGESQLMNKNGLIVILGICPVILYLGSILSHWTKKDDVIIEQTVMVTLTFVFVMLIINIFKVLFIFV